MKGKITALFHTISAYVIWEQIRAFALVAFSLCSVSPWYEILYVSLNILGIIVAVYLYAKYIMKVELSEMYMGKPLPSLKWCITAVLMPTAVCAFYLIFVEGVFAKGDITESQMIHAVCVTLLSQGLRAAVTEEIIFRGMMFYTLKKEFGTVFGILTSSVLFATIHLGNIDTSDWRKVVSILVATTAAGVMLALVTYESGSIWSSVVIHAIYNILSGDGQILHVSTEQVFPAVWTYTLRSRNRLLTGIQGTSDLETGLPAFCGIVIVAVMALYFIRKKGK